MAAGNTIELRRDCDATEIPFGGVQKLDAGTRVRIMQSLGGTFTIQTEHGHMLRVEGKDADALGLDQQAQSAPPAAFSDKAVWDLLKTVYDPEIPVNIVDLGLIYACEIGELDGGRKIDITMSMTAPGCGMADVLKAEIERKLSQIADVKQAHVEVVFDPPWGPERMSEAAKLQLGLDLDYTPVSAFPIARNR